MHHYEGGFFANPANWVLIAFVLFFVLFGRKLWSVLAAMLDDRTATVKAELEEAAKLRREAEAMLREAEAKRAEALPYGGGTGCFSKCWRSYLLQRNCIRNHRCTI